MHKNIKLLALFNFFTDFHLYSAILIIYFAKVTGSFVLGMSLFSVAMVSSALFEIPTGIFSDYIGRKKTMVLGALCSILSVVFYAVGTGYLILFIGALFEGLRRSWYSGNNDALLYETLASTNRKDDYAHYLGKTGAMFQVASAVGIIIGGIIAVYSFSIIMWLSVIPQIICLIIALSIIEPVKQSSQSGNIYSHLTTALAKIWSNKKLRLLSINSIIGYAIGESTYQFRSAFVNTLWPLWAVGFSKVLSSIGAAVSYWYSGKIIKKIGAFRLLLISNLYGKVINIGSVVFATVVSPVLLALTSLFFGATGVASSKLNQKEFTDEQRATLGSINSFLGSLAFGVFAIVLGFLADQYGPTKALLIAYFLSLPTLLINWILFKNNKDE
ncbi:MAG: MFS transporter [Candidatus Roizmanbacteria bacterium]|nr:MAG: MFS transporter [Candidatus Roizmanbacteria bacterium]